MFAHYLELALRSLRRSAGLTTLMVLAIGVGVAASMTTFAVYRAASGDPIPWKSSRLFVPQIDAWGPTARGSDSEPPDALAFADATALMGDHRARYQSAIYEISPTVLPQRPEQHPRAASGYAVYGEFFPMLDVPFRYGQGWSAQDDARGAAVVVIGDALNRELFGDVDSTGRTVVFNGRDYRVVGVLDDWHPQPVFFDVFGTDGFDAGTLDVLMPFERAIAVNLPNGRTGCDKEPAEQGFVGLQHSDCVWITFVAQLDGAAAVRDYRRYLDDYAAEQRRLGRFSWPPNNRLRDLPTFLDVQHVVPPDTRMSVLLAFALLAVCLVNVVGLLLTKFLRRSGEIGVRRALGASRAAIALQFFVEAGVIGAAGGALGVLLTVLGVLGVGIVLPPRLAALAHFDASLLMVTLALALLSSLIAGLYPTLRAARVQPAWQLKSD